MPKKVLHCQGSVACATLEGLTTVIFLQRMCMFQIETQLPDDSVYLCKYPCTVDSRPGKMGEVVVLLPANTPIQIVLPLSPFIFHWTCEIEIPALNSFFSSWGFFKVFRFTHDTTSYGTNKHTGATEREGFISLDNGL